MRNVASGRRGAKRRMRRALRCTWSVAEPARVTLAHSPEGRVPDAIAPGRVRAADARRRASAREFAKNSNNTHNIAVFVVNTTDCS